MGAAEQCVVRRTAWHAGLTARFGRQGNGYSPKHGKVRDVSYTPKEKLSPPLSFHFSYSSV